MVCEKMRKVVHLIPYDGLGGVEEAARSLLGEPVSDVDFQIEYLFPKVSSRTDRAKTFNVFQMLSVSIALVRTPPDILILSLWRSVAAGLVVKLFRPRTRLVLFLHNSRDAHFADRAMTRAGARFASAIWADSAATLERRLPKPYSAPTKVVSFVLRKIDAACVPNPDGKPTPVFAYWGRFSEQKNIPRALRLFSEFLKHFPLAHFHLIGATAKEKEPWRDRVRAAGLEQNVTVHEAMSFEDITVIAAEASFYLQTSNYEGMAMSVVEAMQLGLVPMVTPVGQIGHYCRDGENAVLLPISDDDPESQKHVVSQLTNLLSGDGDDWRQLRAAAISEWKNAKTYRGSFTEALNQSLVN